MGWFNDTLNLLFECDPQSRLTASQIAAVFNCYYNNLGLPDLASNCREIGTQLRKSAKINFVSVNGIARYHLSVRPGSVELPPELVEELAKSRLKYKGVRARITA